MVGQISDAERNYEPKNWTRIDEIPQDARGLNAAEAYRFCNSDSQRFKDLLRAGRGEKAILLDYELLSLGYEPILGGSLERSEDGRTIYWAISAGYVDDGKFAIHYYSTTDIKLPFVI
jgi:hypothetical protein